MTDKSDTIKKRDISDIIRDFHWMARRYCDGRSSYAPGAFNRHTKAILALGFEVSGPLYARDGFGRDFDGLSPEDVRAAELDMPRGQREAISETERRLYEVSKDIERKIEAALKTRGLELWCDHDGNYEVRESPIAALSALPHQKNR